MARREQAGLKEAARETEAMLGLPWATPYELDRLDVLFLDLETELDLDAQRPSQSTYRRPIVRRVTDGTFGSRSRSTADRLVFMRRAIAAFERFCCRRSARGRPFGNFLRPPPFYTRERTEKEAPMLPDSRVLPKALALLLLTATLPLAAAETAAESTGDLLRRYFEECLDQPGDYGCLEEFWTPEKVDGVQRGEQVRRSLFPDLHYEIVEILVDGDRAAVRCKVTGHHGGPAAAGGETAEGRRLEIDEAFFYRLEDGKIQSGKPFSDRWTVAETLGYTMTPPSSN
jgi:predicted ester cyclase